MLKERERSVGVERLEEGGELENEKHMIYEF